jgi:hypothetical protein
MDCLSWVHNPTEFILSKLMVPSKGSIPLLTTILSDRWDYKNLYLVKLFDYFNK